MILILRFALITAAIYVAGQLVPGITVAGVVPAILMAVAFTAVGFIVRPILVLLTFPLTVLTFGLFLLVINAGMFGLAALFVPGVSVNGFFAALLGSFIVTMFRFIGKWHHV